MSEQETVSQLGYALLGLVAMNPSTGYDLRKVFETTPMGRYSSSPGAIYPALKKLQRVGAVRTREIVGKTSRAAHLLSITARGRRMLEAWLRQLPSIEEVETNRDGVLLKFSYLDILQDLEYSLRFLKALDAALHHHLREVEAFRDKAAAHMPIHGHLSLELGVAALNADINWVSDAQKHISRVRKKHGAC